MEPGESLLNELVRLGTWQLATPVLYVCIDFRFVSRYILCVLDKSSNMLLAGNKYSMQYVCDFNFMSPKP
jgi:hypothetical protein